MKTLRTILMVLFASLAPLMAQQPAAAPAPDFKPSPAEIDLKDGDSVVFLGDSITHQCLYTQYVEDFFYTRFPERRIHFHNSGVGGDRAADALIRFDDDVAAFKPKVVTILLGMNDGGYTKFEPAIFDTYEKGMTELLDKIAGIGAAAVPMTPTMHDARAARMRKPAEPRDSYYNSVLAFYGAWLREQASQRGLGFVNMYGPLNNFTVEQRRTNPKFTMIPDAVHPGPAGQFVMAASIISDVMRKVPVFSLNIRPGMDPRKAILAGNGKAANVEITPDKISFTFKANALPWVVPADAVDGVKLTHAGHRYGQERLTCPGLKTGKYELKIDDQAVGAYTDAQLAFGVELEENEKAPDFQQALKVATINKERNDKAVHPLRDLWLKRKIARFQLAKLEQAGNKDALEAKRAEVEKWLPEFKAGVEEKIALARKYEDDIYQANQPVERKYELTRLP
jgi:lysophospholipase L1-like esterase